MKKEFLKGLGLDDEVIAKIHAENGKDIEREKSVAEEWKSKFTEKETSLNEITTQLATLQEQNANAEDWKSKFEEIKALQDQAEQARLADERTHLINNRFNAVLGDKKFSHGAIERDYQVKFAEAIDNAENVGKSDADIFHSLTKDDSTAFVGVQTQPFFNGDDGNSPNKKLDEMNWSELCKHFTEQN